MRAEAKFYSDYAECSRESMYLTPQVRIVDNLVNCVAKLRFFFFELSKGFLSNIFYELCNVLIFNIFNFSISIISIISIDFAYPFFFLTYYEVILYIYIL